LTVEEMHAEAARRATENRGGTSSWPTQEAIVWHFILVLAEQVEKLSD
jgi:hypothetical protein